MFNKCSFVSFKYINDYDDNDYKYKLKKIGLLKKEHPVIKRCSKKGEYVDLDSKMEKLKNEMYDTKFEKVKTSIKKPNAILRNLPGLKKKLLTKIDSIKKEELNQVKESNNINTKGVISLLDKNDNDSYAKQQFKSIIMTIIVSNRLKMKLKNELHSNCHKLEFKIKFYQVQSNLKKAEKFFNENKKIL